MVRHFDGMRQDTKAAERLTRPQPLYNMHNETVNNRRLYVQIVQIFTVTPIFRKVNPRIPLFFHQQNFDFTENLAIHRQKFDLPIQKPYIHNRPKYICTGNKSS